MSKKKKHCKLLSKHFQQQALKSRKNGFQISLDWLFYKKIIYFAHVERVQLSYFFTYQLKRFRVLIRHDDAINFSWKMRIFDARFL